MFQVMKRRKVDPSPATPTASNSVRLHGQFLTQQHQVSGRPGIPMHWRQQQLGSHGRHQQQQFSSEPRAMLRSSSPSPHQDRYPSVDSKRPYERSSYERQDTRTQFQLASYQSQLTRSNQFPSATTTSSPYSSLSSISSSVITSCSRDVTRATSALTSSAATSRATATESSLSLPRISAMLRKPSCSGGDVAAESLSAQSPTLMQRNDVFSAPYKWSSETTSISPIKTNTVAAGYYKSFHLPKTFASPSSTNASEQRIANPNKNSRYLREMDRREILARIEQGEKQATLAKEYQVSRAAICNLNKHRDDVMLRKDENPLAKHPKKPRPKSLKLKTSSSSVKAVNRKLSAPRLNGAGGSGKGNNVHEVKSRAAALLLTSLRNKNTAMSEFRRSSNRLVRLVLEEALALVPIKAVEVLLSDSVRADGVAWEHPPCVISMENQGPTEKVGSPLLDLFRVIEPDQPNARAKLVKEESTQLVNFLDTHLLPASLKYHNVFVFDISATSSDAICAVVKKLQERGTVETMIYLVVLFTDSEVIASVHKKHPGVKIVAAQIDPNGKTLRSASVPVEGGVEGGVDAIANGETTLPSAVVVARPQCCMELVLNRLCQVYSSSSSLAGVSC